MILTLLEYLSHVTCKMYHYCTKQPLIKILLQVEYNLDNNETIYSHTHHKIIINTRLSLSNQLLTETITCYADAVSTATPPNFV